MESCNYLFTLIMLIGYAVNWLKTGTVDPHAMKDYPAIENLIPLTLILSALGLGIAWRWEGLGGVINIGFYLASVVVHFWIIFPRPYPYLIAIASPPLGYCSWRVGGYQEKPTKWVKKIPVPFFDSLGTRSHSL